MSTRRSPSRKLHVSYKEPKVLYRNLGNGRFEDVSAKAGPAIRAENLAAVVLSEISTTMATWMSS